jgi:lauroyl/myristoyl acyltransferase
MKRHGNLPVQKRSCDKKRKGSMHHFADRVASFAQREVGSHPKSFGFWVYCRHKKFKIKKIKEY